MKRIILIAFLVTLSVQFSFAGAIEWTKFKNLPNSGGIAGLITGITKTSSGKLYVGTVGNGISKSTDDGTTWVQIGSGGASEDVRCATKIYTNDDKFIFAFAYNISFFEKTLYFSKNGGGLWEVPAQEKVVKKMQLLSNNTLVIIENKTNKLYYSNDVCQTWKLLSIPGIGNMEIIDIYLSKNNGLLALTKTGEIYYTMDNKLANWTKLDCTLPTGDVTKMAMSEDGRLLVSIDKVSAYYQNADKSGFSKITPKFYSKSDNEVYEVEVLNNNYLVFKYNNSIKDYAVFNTDYYDLSAKATYSMGPAGKDVIDFTVFGDSIYAATTYDISRGKLAAKADVLVDAVSNSIVNVKISSKLCTINVNDDRNIESVELYDVNGTKSLSAAPMHNSVELNLTNYSSGLYFIKTVIDGKAYINKIIIE